jgi:hypothetical protein
MTEYTVSPDAVQEYMSSRERTAYWVTSHSPTKAQFYSPSAPPSELSSPISPPSEIESTHSVPPKMFLKYDDGRPDVPISHWHHDGERGKKRSGDSNARLQSQAHSRSRSISHGPLTAAPTPETIKMGRHGSRHHREQRELHPAPPLSPEEIRVLPSPSQSADMARSHESSHHSRTKSLTRDTRQDGTFSPPPLQVPYRGPLPPSSVRGPSYRSQSTPPVQVAFPQSQQPLPWHVNPERAPYGSQLSQKPSMRTPPAIVYAPANHSKTNYTPPAIYSHPHTRGAPGVIYSHSAPVPQSHYAHTGVIPYPPPHGLASVNEERRRPRSRSRSRRSRERSGSDAASHESGSTYYVLPTAGQKVHIIAPTKSISTATSTTKAPASPRTPNSKKPFFMRFFNFTERFSQSNAESSKESAKPVPGGRRLQRRHSTGASSRRPPPPAHEQRRER